MNERTRILLVCADPAEAQALTGRLERLGHGVCGVAASAQQAVERAADLRPDLALLDVGEDAGVIEAGGRIASSGAVPLVYLIGDLDETLLGRIRETGPSGYVAKPLGDDRQLRLSIDAALSQAAASRAQRERIDFLSAVVNSMSEGVVVAGTDGRVLFVNHAIHELMDTGGESQRIGNLAQAAGKYEILTSDDRTAVAAEFPPRLAMPGELPDDAEIFVRRRDRPTDPGRHLAVSGSPLRDASGQPQGNLAILRDVTRRKKAEAELDRVHGTLRQQKELLGLVLESMSHAVAVFEADGRCVLLNREGRRMTGIGPSGRSLDGFPDAFNVNISYADLSHCPVAEQPVGRVLRGESFDDIHLLASQPEQPEQPEMHVAATGRPLHDSNGRRQGGMILFRDISEDWHREERLKEAERQLQRLNDELQQQNRFMKLVFENISDGLIVADAEGRLTTANRSAKSVLEGGLTDAPYEEWSAIYGFFLPDGETPFPPEQLPLVRAIRGESSNDVEVFLRNPRVPGGMYVSVDGRPMRNLDGVQLGAVAVCRDVTQRVRAREALLRAFDRGRLEVIETVLHNIGNATNSVATGVETIRRQCGDNELVCRFVALADAIEQHEDDWLDWLQSDPQGRNVRPFLLALVRDLVAWNDSLNRTADRASARVQHIVDIIRTQETLRGSQGGKRVVPLRSMLDDAVKMLGDSLTARGIRIAVHCAGAPDAILVEENKFNQMLVNLLKNAMEAIDARLDADAGGDTEPVEPRIDVLARTYQNQLAIDVVDNGIGIEPERRRDVFRAGYTTKALGSGLGLHSAANFIVTAGGNIDVHSDGVGRGATLHVTLPLDPLQQERLQGTPS